MHDNNMPCFMVCIYYSYLVICITMIILLLNRPASIPCSSTNDRILVSDPPSIATSSHLLCTSSSNDTTVLMNLLSQSPPTCLLISMELCDAKTLKDWLDEHNTRKKKDVVEYFDQVSVHTHVSIVLVLYTV